MVRNVALLSSRAVLGSYLAAHGAQKLFGSFDGPGIDAAAAGFHHIGLRPGSIFARVASVSELAVDFPPRSPGWSPPAPSWSPPAAWSWSCATHPPSLPASSPTKDPTEKPMRL